MNCEHECAICAREAAAKAEADRLAKLRADTDAAFQLIKPGHAELLGAAMSGKNPTQLAKWWGCTRNHINHITQEALLSLAKVDKEVAQHVAKYVKVRVETRTRLATQRKRYPKREAPKLEAMRERYSHQGSRDYAQRQCIACSSFYKPTGARQEYCPECTPDKNAKRNQRRRALTLQRRTAELARAGKPQKFGKPNIVMA